MLVAAVAVLTYQPFRFVEETPSLMLGSNSGPIPNEISLFSSDTQYLVGVELRNGEGLANPYLANAANLFSVVLIGNQKNVTMLYFEHDSKGTLLGCRSNMGDVLRDVELTKDECLSFVNDFSGKKVLIKWPDPSREKNLAVFEKGSVSVQSKDFDSLNNLSFWVISRGFPNAQSVIDAVNGMAGSVQ